MAIQLIIAIGICLAVGVISGLATVKAIPTWYGDLRKPVFNPPNWLFGPVWTLLYILMGVALFLEWHAVGTYTNVASIVFYVQLALNFAWSYLFFGLKLPKVALIEVILLWFAILATIIFFYSVSHLAAWLLIPYLVWVTFATALNAAIVRLN